MIYIFSPPRHGSTIVSEVISFHEQVKFYCEDASNYPIPSRTKPAEISLLKMPYLCFGLKDLLNEEDKFIILTRDADQVRKSYKNYNKHPNKTSNSLGVKYEKTILKDPESICNAWIEYIEDVPQGTNIKKINFSLFDEENKVEKFKDIYGFLDLNFTDKIIEKINELVVFSGNKKPTNYGLKAETTRWY